jgi:hypothetical protein
LVPQFLIMLCFCLVDLHLACHSFCYLHCLCTPLKALYMIHLSSKIICYNNLVIPAFSGFC